MASVAARGVTTSRHLVSAKPEQARAFDLLVCVVGVFFDKVTCVPNENKTDWCVSYADLKKNNAVFQRLVGSMSDDRSTLIGPVALGIPILAPGCSLESYVAAFRFVNDCATALDLKPMQYLMRVVSGLMEPHHDSSTVRASAIASAVAMQREFYKSIKHNQSMGTILMDSRSQDLVPGPSEVLQWLLLEKQKHALFHALLATVLRVVKKDMTRNVANDKDKGHVVLCRGDNQLSLHVPRFQRLLLDAIGASRKLLVAHRLTPDALPFVADNTNQKTQFQKEMIAALETINTKSLSGLYKDFQVAAFVLFADSKLSEILPGNLLDLCFEYCDSDTLESSISYELLLYGVHRLVQIPMLQNALPWRRRIVSLRKPVVERLANAVALAEREFDYFEKKDQLKNALNKAKMETDRATNEVERCQAAVAMTLGVLRQNCVTMVCQRCGDEYPLHSAFRFEEKIGFVRDTVCPPCMVCNAPKCEQCLQNANERCRRCTTLRQTHAQPTRRIRVGRRRGRWPSANCSVCKIKYYTQIPTPPRQAPVCAYCQHGMKHIAFATQFEKETPDPTKNLTPQATKARLELMEAEETLVKLKADFETAKQALSTHCAKGEEEEEAESKRAKGQGEKDKKDKKGDEIKTLCAICRQRAATMETQSLFVCAPCIGLAETALARFDSAVTEQMAKIPMRHCSHTPPLLTYAVHVARLNAFQPWIIPPKQEQNNGDRVSPPSAIDFQNIIPWTTEFLKGNNADDDEKEHAVLSMYRRLGLQVDMTARNGRFVFAARDRPKCEACTHLSLCQHCWYPAHLVIKGVTDTHARSHERILILVYPGWPPAAGNQVSADLLYMKKKINDPELANDCNIRVFLWSELQLLANEVGTIRPGHVGSTGARGPTAIR